MVQLVFDPWDASYGSAFDLDDDLPVRSAELDTELPLGGWQPVPAPRGPGAGEVVFVDGVQRVDGRITVIDGDRRDAALAASFAAGAVRHSGGRAVVERVTVRRMLFSESSRIEALDCGHGAVYAPGPPVTERSPDALRNALSTQMRALEAVVATAATGADLLVVDGPLYQDPDLPDAVGLIKSHRQRYFPEGSEQDRVLAELPPRQRTPLFVTEGRYPRYSWYLRLPGGLPHPWADLVRCETAGTAGRQEAVRRANLVTATLPRFASSPHRDPRAPQNLTPVGELERQLRHRLGDPRLLDRMLRRACSTYAAAAAGETGRAG